MSLMVRVAIRVWVTHSDSLKTYWVLLFKPN